MEVNPNKNIDQPFLSSTSIVTQEKRQLFEIRCGEEYVQQKSINVVETSSLPIATPPSITTSFLSYTKNVRPILVGYAFGKKKMSTMGIIMAEASKALSTIMTAALYDSDCESTGEESEHEERTPDTDGVHEGPTLIHGLHQRTTNTVNNNICIDMIGANGGNEKSGIRGKHRKKENMNHTFILNSYLENDSGYGDGDESPFDRKRIKSKVKGVKSKPLTPSSVAITPVFASLPVTDKLKDDQSVGSDSMTPSLITLSTGFSSTSSISSVRPIVGNVLNSTAQNRENSISSRMSNISEIGSNRLELEHESNSNVSNYNPKSNNVLKPIRVSFVPLDLDSSLEEQHGGKFDAILHKLTEDILCISKLPSNLVPLSMQRNLENQLVKGDNTHDSYLKKNVGKNHNDVLNEMQKQALARVERLNKYKRDHPSCCLIDHPANIKPLMSRADMTYVLSQCLKGVVSTSGIPVRNPLYCVLGNNDKDRSILDAYKDGSERNNKQMATIPFSFPFIAKPLTAAGTSHSHKMGIVLGRKGISRIQLPCLLQEYSNHDGVLYKVYVLGDLVQVFPRLSLPNLPEEECLNDKYSFVEFDSQRPYPTLRDFGVDESMNTTANNQTKRNNEISSQKQQNCDSNKRKRSIIDENDNCSKSNEEKTKVTVEEIRPLASVIRKAFGLELFGFDVLVIQNKNKNKNREAKEMLVVDVNYFPSYKEISAFPSLLAQYLTQKAIEGRLQSFQSS